MKLRWKPIVQVLLALVATAILVGKIDASLAEILYIRDPEGKLSQLVSFRSAAYAFTAFPAYLVGGAIAGRSFAIPAALLAVATGFWGIQFFANWHGTDFSTELSRSWLPSLVGILASFAGIACGALLNGWLSSRFRRDAA